MEDCNVLKINKEDLEKEIDDINKKYSNINYLIWIEGTKCFDENTMDYLNYSLRILDEIKDNNTNLFLIMR